MTLFFLVATGLKNLYEGEGEVPPFFAAACELVLGLLPIVGEFVDTGVLLVADASLTTIT